MAKIVQIGENSKVVFCDNMDKQHGIPSLDDESVALSFFSPPYFDYIDYAGGQGIGNLGETYEEYMSALARVFGCLYSKIIPGGWILINATNMKSRLNVEGESFMYPIMYDIMTKMQEQGYIFFDEIIWNKSVLGARTGGRPLFGSYPYPSRPRILNSNFENIIVFTKDGRRKVDPDIKEKSKLSWEDWKTFTRGIWDIRTDTEPEHPATFPIELAERVVRLYSFVGDLIVDPFSGTGTTTVAAEMWGRRGIGFEIAEEYASPLETKNCKHIRQLRIFQ